jgi:DNA topoisomerase VI subunit B
VIELNKAILDCMRELRRRLREEQALEIQYQQSDAIERMLRACAESACEETRQLGERLSELSGVKLPRMVQEPSFLPMQGSADQQYSGPLRGGARPSR